MPHLRWHPGFITRIQGRGKTNKQKTPPPKKPQSNNNKPAWVSGSLVVNICVYVDRIYYVAQAGLELTMTSQGQGQQMCVTKPVTTPFL